jgi:hypothetical protein
MVFSENSSILVENNPILIMICYFTRCKAIVTSPMYWYWTECFIIGEYTLTTNDADGWDTAERECFDRDFRTESKALIHSIILKVI